VGSYQSFQKHIQMSRRKPKTHTIRTWRAFFGPVQDGTKPFVIGENKLDFQIGDTLIIREWCQKEDKATGRECRAAITFASEWQQLRGNVVLGIRLLPQDSECSQLGEDFSKLPMCAE
jgi:hypothetical protein